MNRSRDDFSEKKATDREARGLALPVSDLPHTDIRFSFLADQKSRSLRNLDPFMYSRKSAGRAEVSERVFMGYRSIWIRPRSRSEKLHRSRRCLASQGN